MKKLIGISGKLKSGKSTVAKLLLEAFPQDNIIIESFAKPLKEEVVEMLIWDNELEMEQDDRATWLNEINANKQYYRKLLQWWGTDYRRRRDPDYWINLLSERLAALPDDATVIIDDVRFSNEAGFIKSCHGQLWRIWSLNDSHETHASESELDNYFLFDANIANVSSIETLKQKVTSLYEQQNLL